MLACATLIQPLKKVTVKFTGAEDDKDDHDDKQTPLLARISESAEKSLHSAFASHFGNTDAIVATLANVFNGYQRIVLSFGKPYHLTSSGMYSELTAFELCEVGQGVLEREFNEIITKRCNKICYTIASRFPEHIGQINLLLAKLAAALRAKLDQIRFSSNISKVIAKSVPTRDLNRLALEVTDVFALNNQVYRMTDELSEPQAICDKEQLENGQLYGLHVDKSDKSEGPKQLVSTELRLFIGLLTSALLQNRFIEQHLVLRITGCSEFVECLQKLAHTYGNTAAPISALANATPSTIGGIATKHIRRVTFLSGATKTVSRALIRLRDHSVPTLPIVITETTEQLSVPDHWKIVNLRSEHVSDLPLNPNELLHLILAGRLNDANVGELIRTLPTAGQLKAEMIRQVLEHFIKINSIESAPTEVCATKRVTPLSVAIKRIVKLANETGHTNMSIDQTQMSAAFESLSFSVTKPQNVYHVAWFTAGAESK